MINKTVDILKQHSVERLDILCWTHPHEDHSKGISTLISKYCDEETKVLFPMYVLNNTSDIVNLKFVSKDIVDGILAANRSKNSLATPIGIPYQSRTIIDEFIITNSYNTDETRAVSIDAITPISSYLTEFVNHGICKDPNELSISLIVNIDGYGFFFGGDTINKHINGARKRSINICRFVKIPHHSSPTASELLNYLPGKIDAACTTVYKVGNSLLPDNDIVAKYKGFCPTILSTGDKNTVSKKTHTELYHMNMTLVGGLRPLHQNYLKMLLFYNFHFMNILFSL